MYLHYWHGWCHMKLLPSQHVLCAPYTHAPCHFMQSHIRKVCACLAVTCTWQNDQDLLRDTAVTRGWNGYRNKSQHKKLTPENKISHCSFQGSDPWPFDHKSGALTTELSLLPGNSPSAHNQGSLSCGLCCVNAPPFPTFSTTSFLEEHLHHFLFYL